VGVLVVDDDASIRLLCRLNLELEGWTVREAATLGEAREQLADGTVRIVLLDVHVGSEDGASFIGEIRVNHPEARVAMLTGVAGRPPLGAAPPDRVITKPFTLDELTATVADLARR
jgi:DNA-binding response OmpR family regulator